ncbi:MAG TPA: hypothetical protein VK183_01990 [Flavobacterium sp.]|nr:hypothetical protein [Flavobacterium sp.]
MKLLENLQATDPNAPIVLLFGGNPVRRHAVLQLLSTVGDLHAVGVLSEQEGYDQITSLSRLNIILIGGRYDDEQRKRIKAFAREHFPDVRFTEPGVEYPYDDHLIRTDIRKKLGW